MPASLFERGQKKASGFSLKTLFRHEKLSRSVIDFYSQGEKAENDTDSETRRVAKARFLPLKEHVKALRLEAKAVPAKSAPQEGPLDMQLGRDSRTEAAVLQHIKKAIAMDLSTAMMQFDVQDRGRLVRKSRKINELDLYRCVIAPYYTKINDDASRNAARKAWEAEAKLATAENEVAVLRELAQYVCSSFALTPFADQKSFQPTHQAHEKFFKLMRVMDIHDIVPVFSLYFKNIETGSARQKAIRQNIDWLAKLACEQSLDYPFKVSPSDLDKLGLLYTQVLGIDRCRFKAHEDLYYVPFLARSFALSKNSASLILLRLSIPASKEKANLAFDRFINKADDKQKQTVETRLIEIVAAICKAQCGMTRGDREQFEVWMSKVSQSKTADAISPRLDAYFIQQEARETLDMLCDDPGMSDETLKVSFLDKLKNRRKDIAFLTALKKIHIDFHKERRAVSQSAAKYIQAAEDWLALQRQGITKPVLPTLEMVHCRKTDEKIAGSITDVERARGRLEGRAEEILRNIEMKAVGSSKKAQKKIMQTAIEIAGNEKEDPKQIRKLIAVMERFSELNPVQKKLIKHMGYVNLAYSVFCAVSKNGLRARNEEARINSLTQYDRDGTTRYLPEHVVAYYELFSKRFSTERKNNPKVVDVERLLVLASERRTIRDLVLKAQKIYKAERAKSPVELAARLIVSEAWVTLVFSASGHEKVLKQLGKLHGTDLDAQSLNAFCAATKDYVRARNLIRLSRLSASGDSARLDAALRRSDFNEKHFMEVAKDMDLATLAQAHLMVRKTWPNLDAFVDREDASVLIESLNVVASTMPVDEHQRSVFKFISAAERRLDLMKKIDTYPAFQGKFNRQQYRDLMLVPDRDDSAIRLRDAKKQQNAEATKWQTVVRAYSGDEDLLSAIEVLAKSVPHPGERMRLFYLVYDARFEMAHQHWWRVIREDSADCYKERVVPKVFFKTYLEPKAHIERLYAETLSADDEKLRARVLGSCDFEVAAQAYQDISNIAALSSVKGDEVTAENAKAQAMKRMFDVASNQMSVRYPMVYFKNFLEPAINAFVETKKLLDLMLERNLICTLMSEKECAGKLRESAELSEKMRQSLYSFKAATLEEIVEHMHDEFIKPQIKGDGETISFLHSNWVEHYRKHMGEPFPGANPLLSRNIDPDKRKDADNIMKALHRAMLDKAPEKNPDKLFKNYCKAVACFERENDFSPQDVWGESLTYHLRSMQHSSGTSSVSSVAIEAKGLSELLRPKNTYEDFKRELDNRERAEARQRKEREKDYLKMMDAKEMQAAKHKLSQSNKNVMQSINMVRDLFNAAGPELKNQFPELKIQFPSDPSKAVLLYKREFVSSMTDYWRKFYAIRPGETESDMAGWQRILYARLLNDLQGDSDPPQHHSFAKDLYDECCSYRILENDLLSVAPSDDHSLLQLYRNPADVLHLKKWYQVYKMGLVINNNEKLLSLDEQVYLLGQFDSRYYPQHADNGLYAIYRACVSGLINLFTIIACILIIGFFFESYMFAKARRIVNSKSAWAGDAPPGLVFLQKPKPPPLTEELQLLRRPHARDTG